MILLAVLACRDGSINLEGDDTGSEPVDTEPVVPEPDFSHYEAQLSWTYDTWGDSYDCTDSSVETAVEITAEDPEFEGLSAACPLCDRFYVAEYDNSEICGWMDMPTPDYRGMVFGEGNAQVYRFDEGDSGFTEDLLDNAASWDGWTLSFTAEIRYFGDLSVDSTTTFEEL